MAIKTKEDLLKQIKDRIGEDTSDEAISFIEDVTDTLDDLESKTKDQTDWKKKFEENDADWRKKYKERFFEGPTTVDDKDKEIPIDGEKKMNFEELFTDEKGDK